ncbi:hypothetical protein PVAP13_2KG108701 [Panicum virgatum]|uniref:Uncharacterized protein n=1 Tax=Panicum virgatum TaxID=38727 RepID=A0A8T0WXB5_PANVG|nr:hypothetical protein PVAP13_2KG108701 [Panicum virgatum]
MRMAYVLAPDGENPLEQHYAHPPLPAPLPLTLTLACPPITALTSRRRSPPSAPERDARCGAWICRTHLSQSQHLGPRPAGRLRALCPPVSRRPPPPPMARRRKGLACCSGGANLDPRRAHAGPPSLRHPATPLSPSSQPQRPAPPLPLLVTRSGRPVGGSTPPRWRRKGRRRRAT